MIHAEKKYTLTPAQVEDYFARYVRKDDECLGQKELFATEAEAHWWAALEVLSEIESETGVALIDIDELFEVA